MSGVTGATGSPIQIDHEALRASMPAKTIKQGNENSTTASDHSNSQAGANHCPTDGGREVTSTTPLTHDEIERATNERLSNDPEYQKLLARQAELAQAEIDFSLVDGNTLGQDDQVIDMAALRALAGDPHAEPGARAAAQRLLNNVALWNELATGLDGKNDNRVGSHDVSRLKAANADQLKAYRDTTKGEIKVEDAARVGAAATAAGAAGTGQTGQPGQTGATATQNGTSPLFKAPTPSTKSGMEGAVENVGNTLTAIGDSMNAMMAQLSNPELKPEDRQRLQARYNELQQLQGMLTSMYKQLQEAIANLMKMYSDVASNSIRNMR